MNTYRARNGSHYFPVRTPRLHSIPLWEAWPSSSMLSGSPLIPLSPKALLYPGTQVSESENFVPLIYKFKKALSNFNI